MKGRRLLSLLLSGTGLLAGACSPSGEPAQVTAAQSAPAVRTPAPSRRPLEAGKRQITIPVSSGEVGGILYLPDADGPVPLILLCHGLGASHTSLEDWAQAFALRGYAAFTFDFRGCGSLSTGSPYEMSVMTEAEDVSTVLSEARTWEFADPEKIVILGESQGGFAGAAAASLHPQELAALILLYPAFVIPVHIHARFSSKEEVPEVFTQLGVPLGRRYALDLWDYDVYDEIGAYEGPVLIIHGTADDIVPFSYSQKALEVYKNAVLIPFEGAGHGFFSERSQAFEDAAAFLADEGIVP